jgi:hypothetical protein
MTFSLLFTILFLSGFSAISPHPRGSPSYLSVSQPVNWHVKEKDICPQGYQCYGGVWVPQVNVYRDIWIFGVSNNEQKGGILHFRSLPTHPCTTHCVEKLPISCKAEVIYVPHTGGDYSFEDVPLTFIPKGNYVVTSPSFFMHYNMKLWVFLDDGTGPEKMSVTLDTDKEKYGREDASVLLTLQVADNETGTLMQVDSLYGTIFLPDQTKKTLVTEDWSWNEDHQHYEYLWDFENDAGETCNPKEGFYSAEAWVKKRYYQDEYVVADFSVCYHIAIDAALDHSPPVYELGEPVKVTVTIVDESGAVVTGDLDIELVQPDGQPAEVGWVHANDVYTLNFQPTQEGLHSLTVSLKDDVICYLEKAHAHFLVSDCEEALIDLTLTEPIVNEVITAELVITDPQGNSLPGIEIESELYTPNGSLTLSWTESGDGVYSAEFTPTETGFYQICGYFYTPAGSCYKGFFEAACTVMEKRMADLLIRNEDISVDPEPELGDTVTISVTVHNVGNKDAEDFWVVILINDWVVYWEFFPVLPAGASYTLEYEWQVIHSGAHIIQAFADAPESMIPEGIV